MEADPRDRSRGLVAAALGSGIAGVGTYLAIAIGNPTNDVTTSQFLTLDAKGELELEGLAILFALYVAWAASIIGTWLSLWLFRHTFAFTTALLLVPVLVVGGFGIEGVQFDLSRAPGRTNIAWLMGLWPFAAGLATRGLIVAILGHRTERPEGARSRLADLSP